MAGKTHLGAFEQLVMLAILQLRDDAFGPSISASIEDKADRQVSRGALYATLDRLEDKGMLEWDAKPATEHRGGHRRRRFRVTSRGIRALADSRRTLINLWHGLEDVFSGVPR